MYASLFRRCTRARALVLSIFALTVTHSNRARADTILDTTTNGNGINTRLFRPAVDSKGFFSVNGTDVIGKMDYAFGLVLDGGFGLLRVRDHGPATGALPQGVERDPTRL